MGDITYIFKLKWAFDTVSIGLCVSPHLHGQLLNQWGIVAGRRMNIVHPITGYAII